MRALASNRTRLIQAALVAVFLAPLLAHMLAGTSSRPLADDYCFGHVAITRGWWGAMVYWFNSWQGTFSSTGLQTALALIGPGAFAVLPALLVASWWTGLVWAIYEFNRLVHLRSPAFVALFTGSLLLFAVVEGAPNVHQTFYWTSGSVTYVTPMAILSFHAGLILRALRRAPTGRVPVVTALLSGIVAFFSAGFSPVFAALQGSLLALGILACLRFVSPDLRRTALPLLVMGLVGSAIGLALMAGAPGNAIRQSRFPPPPAPPMLAFINLYVTAAFTATDIVIFAPLPLAVTLVCSGLLANRLPRLEAGAQARFKRYARRLLALASTVCLGLFLVIFLPSSYSVSDLPPARALIIPHFVLVLTAMSWGVIMGLSLQKPGAAADPFAFSRVSAAVLIALLLLGPLRATWNTLARAAEFRTFAAEWDSRDRQIRAAVGQGVRTLDAPKFSVDLAEFVNVNTMTDQPNAGVNACVEDYYGLEAFSVH